MPLPQDAPLLAIEDVAAYLRLTPAAVRRMIDGRSDADDEVGKVLRAMVVRLSPRRRYIRKAEFFKWLCERAGVEVNSANELFGGKNALAS